VRSPRQNSAILFGAHGIHKHAYHLNEHAYYLYEHAIHNTTRINVLATKTHPAVFWLTSLSSQSFISKLTVSCKIYNTHNHQGYVKPRLQVRGGGGREEKMLDLGGLPHHLPPYTVPRTLEPASQDLVSNTSNQEEYYCVRYLQE
jgi:hypothetical protein